MQSGSVNPPNRSDETVSLLSVETFFRFFAWFEDDLFSQPRVIGFRGFETVYAAHNYINYNYDPRLHDLLISRQKNSSFMIVFDFLLLMALRR